MRMRVRRKERSSRSRPPAGHGRRHCRPRSRRRVSLSFQRTLEGYFVAPWVVGSSSSWPGLFQSFFLSFHELQATSLSDLKFRGIDNYKEAFFIDARFLPRLKETLTQNLLDVPVIMIFSLFSAILANQKIKGVIVPGRLLPAPGDRLRPGHPAALQPGRRGRRPLPRVNIQELAFQYLGPDAASGVEALLNRLLFVLWKTGVQMLIFLAGLNSMSRRCSTRRARGRAGLGPLLEGDSSLLSP